VRPAPGIPRALYPEGISIGRPRTPSAPRERAIARFGVGPAATIQTRIHVPKEVVVRSEGGEYDRVSSNLVRPTVG
jgi:hypothetical protein